VPIRRALGLLLALTTLICVLAPSVALAAGGSAADSQYQDPLAAATTGSTSTGTTKKTAPHSPATGHGSSTVKSAPSTLSPTAPASIVTNPQQKESLPLTGLNVEAVAFVGLFLVATGLTLRWRVARSRY
jgi:hypothetical protein